MSGSRAIQTEPVRSLSGLAVITGAAKGIGLGIAEVVAERGMRVVLVDTDATAGEAAAERLRSSGLRVEFAATDVCDIDAFADLLQALDTHDPLEVLVNNAGILRSTPLIEVMPDEFDAIVDVNLRAAFFALQAAARLMLPRERGAIVNISSTTAFQPATILPQSVYSTSKAGLKMLTTAAARELAPHGIRVTGVAPSTIDTPMVRDQATDEQLRAHVAAKVPIGRLGTPRDIGEAVAYLVSDAGSYVLGHTMVVDGGKLT